MNSPETPSFFFEFKNEGLPPERGASWVEMEYESKNAARAYLTAAGGYRPSARARPGIKKG
jgi:hypothetical protein